MFRRIATIALVGLLASGQAALAGEAGRMGAISGSVMLNQNGRMVPATAGSVLQSGDRVIAANGSARISYADGCNVAVTARSMVTIAATSPCAGGSSGLVKVVYQARDDKEGGGAYGYISRDDWLLWIGYGVITAAAASAGLSDDDEPVSP